MKKGIYADKVSIIVLNYNGKSTILECLTSLQQLHYPNYEVIVVDNGSEDGSVQVVQQQFPDITILQNSENFGFAEGNNCGIRYALEVGSHYILLLNNDTVVEPSFLSSLVTVGKTYPDIGMLNPLIYTYNPETIWFCAGEINWGNGVTHHVTELAQTTHFPECEDIIFSEYVTGCALLVKSEVIQKIGFLDPRFFAYYEDTDWSIRCQKAGWKTVVVPMAKIWHKVSSTALPQEAFIWGHRNLIFFLWKHSSILQFPFRFRRAVYKCLHEFHWHREKALGKAAMHGLWSAITFQFGKEYRKMPDWLLQFVDNNIRYFLKIFG
jgi:GT2 family glycosyltransferase